MKCMKVYFLYLVLVILYGILTGAAPNTHTTNNEVDQEEISTTSEHITIDKLFQNKTVSILNISSVPVVTTTVNNIPNSTDTLVTAAGRNINGRVVNTTYNYYTSNSSSSSSGLSGGAIAGIVIGLIVLICCCGALGCCKSGHWETRKVWVQH
jgi:hypothetical protein